MDGKVHPEWGYGYFISQETIDKIFSKEMQSFIDQKSDRVFLELGTGALNIIRAEGRTQS